MLGPACTVTLYPSHNLMVHKALDIALPGEVAVVDSGGSVNTAALGISSPPRLDTGVSQGSSSTG
jgi:regulator of RNase E activity RraA